MEENAGMREWKKMRECRNAGMREWKTMGECVNEKKVEKLYFANK
jgi:hypothetical protein